MKIKSGGQQPPLPPVSPSDTAKVSQAPGAANTDAPSAAEAPDSALTEGPAATGSALRASGPRETSPASARYLSLDSIEGLRAAALAQDQVKALLRRTSGGGNNHPLQNKLQLDPIDVHVDRLGETHIRYNRVFTTPKGERIPVFGEQVVLHVTKDDRLLEPTGEVKPRAALMNQLQVAARREETTTRVKPEEAAKAALTTFGRLLEASEKPVVTDPDLFVYPHPDGTVRYAYVNQVIDLGAESGGFPHPAIMNLVVDAHSGKVIDTWNELCHAELSADSVGNESRQTVGGINSKNYKIEPHFSISDNASTPWTTVAVTSKGKVRDLSVDFGTKQKPGVIHNWPRSLVVELMAPSGQLLSVPVRLDEFDKEKKLFGDFVVKDAEGLPAEGNWKLRVRDADGHGDSGTFRNATVRMTTAEPHEYTAEVDARITSGENLASVINVKGRPFAVAKAYLNLEIQHERSTDMTVSLESPDGTAYQVHKKFDGALSGRLDVSELFEGVPATGKWILRIEDHSQEDDGALLRWGVTLEPGSLIDLIVDPSRGNARSTFYGDIPLETTKVGEGFQLKHDIVETKNSKGQHPNRAAGNWRDPEAISDSNNVWIEQDTRTGVDAHYSAVAMRNFLADVFGRDSIDGRGMPIRSVVNVGRSFVNAFWYKDMMHYGNGDGRTAGPLTTIDIGGHEIAHGVTEKTAGLIYRNESGGLNEATSDILGTALEWYVGKKNPAVKFDWKLGEDTWTPTGPADDALRYMSDPIKDGRSIDHYSKYTRGINVHYSSGIANNFFYLLVEGGKNRTSGLEVEGLKKAEGGGEQGMDEAMLKGLRIWYRALSVYLRPSSTFAEARVGCEKAAKDLYGEDSAALAQVRSAWTAVGVEKKATDLPFHNVA